MKHLAFFRLFLYLFLGILLYFILLTISPFTDKVLANNDPTSYPYKTGPTCATGTCTSDQWWFYQRECTSYAAWRVNSNHKSVNTFFYNTMFGTGDKRFSHAGNWDNAITLADSNGYETYFFVDRMPAVGAIAQWESGTYGHVAYVEKVYLNGNIDVSEYNYNNDGNYGYRSNIPPADRYIHFNSNLATYTGVVGGYVNNATNFINLNPTLVTATVTSNAVNNTDFYYQYSYFGTYEMRLPSGFVTLSANDNYKQVTYKNLYVPAFTTKIHNIVLNNQCIDLASGATLTNCGSTPYISLPNSGSNLLIGGAYGEFCLTPPTTTSNVTGATQGNNGWWRSSVKVSFYPTATCGTENMKTYYSINGGSQQTYTAPFDINQEGIFNITYYSVDGKGNVESNKSVEVKIDWTPPVTTGTATGPRDTNGLFRNDVTAQLNGSDNLSGVEMQRYTLDGGSNWIDKSGNNNTFVISGNGVSRFLFKSEDKAGNLEVSKDSGPIIINKYVIFSNGSNNSLRFLRSTGVNISGDIHSNGTVSFESNTGSSIGTTISTVGVNNVFATSNTKVTIPTITKGVNSVQMLSYPLSMYKSLARVVFPSSLYMNSVSSTYSGIIYVEGDVTMTDVSLSGPLSIVATGTITDITTNSTYQTGDPNNGVLLYAGKDVNVNSTGNRNLGLVYAPTGTVFVKATNLTLNGSIVGNEVEVGSTTTLNLSYNPGFSSASYTLPLSAMGLVKPSNVTTTLASIPNLSKPTNGSTGISNTRPKISWYTSVGAFGYQLQLSTSSNFSTIEFDGSYVSTVANPTLLKRTKYYWRVRSINEAGVSNWSSVRYFTTL